MLVVIQHAIQNGKVFQSRWKLTAICEVLDISDIEFRIVNSFQLPLLLRARFHARVVLHSRLAFARNATAKMEKHAF